MRFLLVTLLALWLSGGVFAQRVGVVLSGGGAKGLAHIGVLKALEDSEIPIDYIVGTSMGGVVGGCYAAGMSPQQIEDIILSPDFLDWMSGRLEKGHSKYYHRRDDDASFLKINLSLDSTFSLSFNSSLANDLSLNFALAERLAQPSAIAKNNFDSLFVPLRVVAADIFTQTEVILKDGVLSDAVRATHTVPFFYNPIKVNGKYLFDGGIYNNFPVDVAQKEFNPDVIIGSNVSSKVFKEYPYGEDEKLVSRSLLYLILDKSDPESIPSTGVYIQPNLEAYSALDFDKAKSLIDSGYQATMRKIAEIKSKVGVSRTCESVAESRNAFNRKTEPLLIDRIRFNGFNSRQQRYINQFFNSGKRPLYFSEVKASFFDLVSEEYFKNVYPNFLYTPSTRRFDFQLSRRPQNNFQVDFGGVITSRSVSNIFLGLNYYYFNRSLTHASLNFYVGGFYKSAQVKARIDVPWFRKFYIEPEATFNTWDFLVGDDILIRRFSPTILYRIDRKVGANFGVPVGGQFKAVLNAHVISNFDRFSDLDVVSSADTLDELRLSGIRLGLNVGTNQLNRKQYASQGKAYELSFDWFSLDENMVPGSTSVLEEEQRANRQWIRARLRLEQYFKTGFYSSGYLVEGVFSNQPFFSNYRASMINAPAFLPLQDSRTLLLPNFRAYNYVAGGWRNVFAVRPNIDIRLEGYAFKSIEELREGPGQTPTLRTDFTDVHFAASAGIVMHSTVGPISLNFNYYDQSQNQFGVLLHVGFLLFHKQSME